MMMESTTEKMEAMQLGENGSPLKENINIVFVGHVDAGKSTISGQILNVTGNIDKRVLEKYAKEAKELNRESWYFSWAMDTSQEERAKGITVECGIATFELPRRRFTILDAPGHKNYVPNMISGAVQADIPILVISARKGEFETGFEKGGQTREHATLVKIIGLKRLIVVVNKMDDQTVNWSKDRFDEIVSKVTPFLKSVGYSVANEVTYIPISGFSAINLLEPMPTGVCDWYKGPSLLQFLDTMPGVERKYDAPFIMPIANKFRDLGTMVTGKLECGIIAKGQSVIIMPNKKMAEVAAVYMEETELKQAIAGDNIKLKLKGVEEEEISVGFVICDPSKPIHSATSFVAKIMFMDVKSIIAPGYTAVMHVHMASEEVTIKKFVCMIDKKTGEKIPKRPKFVVNGDAVIIQFECKGPVCLEAIDQNPQLGRITLRDEGKTIAMGQILKILAAESDASAGDN